MRRSFCFSGSWQHAISTRIAIVLGALWLCIAPQWHLCEDRALGSSVGQAPGVGKSPCCLHAMASQAKTSQNAAPEQQVLQCNPASDGHSVTFCLARYLEFFPLLSALAFVFLTLISLQRLLFRVPLRRIWLCPVVLRASRGPPCFSC